MLDLIGRAYIMQHCWQEAAKELANESYRKYIADSLWCDAHQKSLVKQWENPIAYRKPIKEASAEDIIGKMIEKFEEGGK